MVHKTRRFHFAINDNNYRKNTPDASGSCYHITPAWRSLRGGEKNRKKQRKIKRAAGGRRVWNAVRKFRNTCKSFVLQKKKKNKTFSGCCQLVFGVALTFLQLCHHVVVFEEGLAAEGVCQQHLDHEEEAGGKSEV